MVVCEDKEFDVIKKKKNLRCFLVNFVMSVSNSLVTGKEAGDNVAGSGSFNIFS